MENITKGSKTIYFSKLFFAASLASKSGFVRDPFAMLSTPGLEGLTVEQIPGTHVNSYRRDDIR